ncbi:hypothetical protein GNI_211310 [Gregarina niphandrodes]|uniref:Uncharacterized protein n=1 Tax=Gregarina niphandrodes TaxID=110365 RepID=A0A023AWV6_GRENI|nr:hypothetical protein GNI_211310 [Gregarina niphandrodes]EZG42893.1 hypothetical protein GNI_211310 [Gregarina niphandrodes]|eukprot:XP_011134690.1 hypothetical protein GNI_211310 [Gregarina niphandrodes]
MNSEVADQLMEMRQQLDEQRVGFESKLEEQRAEMEKQRAEMEKQRAEMEADRQDAVYPVRFRGFIEAAAKFVALKRAKEMAPAPTGQLLRIGSLEEPDLLDGEGIQAGRTVKGYPSHSRLDAPLATVYSCLEKHWNRTSGQWLTASRRRRR